MTDHWPCCWEGCDAPATFAITFRGQPGHVHDCTRHTATLREWADVEHITDLSQAPCCPHIHGVTWRDSPVELVV